jgi:hypothetical protein
MARPLDLIVNGTFQPAAITDAVVPWRDAADALMAQPQKIVIQR